MRTRIFLCVLSLTALLGCACRSGSQATGETARPAASETACPDQRPEVCTQEVEPVCAKRDNGVRCVTEPCPSFEWATYSNACTACADERVFAHVPGSCE